MLSNNLHLYEAIMLLALRDKEGTVESGAMYQYAVGGAILAELLLSRRICIEEPKRRRKLVTLVSAERVGDDLIDECLARIAKAKRRRAPAGWVSSFCSLKRLKHRAVESLCRRGILAADEDKVLLIFSRSIYPEINPEPERRLIDRLAQAIFTDTEEIDPETVVLVSLAKSTNILPAVFDKKELKARRKRIEQIVNGEIMGKAAKEAIEAAQAAVIVACLMPAMMTAVTTSAATR